MTSLWFHCPPPVCPRVLPSYSEHSPGVALDAALTRAIEDNGDVALLALDLDHFKRINDEFGHSVGDAVLCEVAATLTDAVGESGVVARLGGEEFSVMLPSADAEAAGVMAERMLTRLRACQSVAQAHGATVTMSMAQRACCTDPARRLLPGRGKLSRTQPHR